KAGGREVGDHDAGALPGQPQRGGAPDARAGAGHDRGPAREPAGNERLEDALGVGLGGELAGARHGGAPCTGWKLTPPITALSWLSRPPHTVRYIGGSRLEFRALGIGQPNVVWAGPWHVTPLVEGTIVT